MYEYMSQNKEDEIEFLPCETIKVETIEYQYI